MALSSSWPRFSNKDLHVGARVQVFFNDEWENAEVEGYVPDGLKVSFSSGYVHVVRHSDLASRIRTMAPADEAERAYIEGSNGL